ncbi:MAG TPA: hypothetical protein VIN03_13310 [Roseateles sp.]
MRIACIGWGSLVWKPGVLHCAGPWQMGGPSLPVEFARTSQDGRLTLVLLDGVPPVPTRFVELSYATAEQAQEALAGREGSGVESIGLWPGPEPKYPVGAAAIAEWGAASGFDAVVWTALRPKFRGRFEHVPENADDVLSYLRELDAETAARAREYVSRAPPELRTPYRAVIEAELGWLPSGVD